MKEQKRIPIFYACDDNFVKYTAVSLRSMMDNASAGSRYAVHILHTGISEDMQQVLMAMETEQFQIRFCDVTEYQKSIADRLPLRDYYSKTTYYRFFIAELFPEYEKAIYIDSDTIVLGDMAQLFAIDLGECYVGACRDQAIFQEELFGTYVEKVLGVGREEAFNAGMLVINCEQFRKNRVLEQFLELLHMYDFVVAQDEDYLNVICHGHVLLLPEKWNVQVFGELPCAEEEIGILHYIMVSKPWHYADCRLGGYFWDYAKKTAVYGKIRQELLSYTDENRARDAISATRLKELVVSEIYKENNYLNLVRAGKLKSKERLEVLDKIARLEREGRFDEDVEEDPPTRELKPREIDYLRKKMSSRIKTRLTYRVARNYLNRILENKQLIIKDVKGIENMDALDSGAVITCNHFNAFDSFAIQIAYERSKQRKKRKLYRVIREGNYTNFPGFYGMLMRNCYTFPLSSNKETMKKFMRSMDAVLQHGDFMVIYPEQSMWWNYRKPKPLKKGAYTFAVGNHVPVLPCFITMEDSDVLGDDGFYVQAYTIHIAPPIYPDPDKSRAENVVAMRDKNYEIWKEIYETTYGEPLVYECENRMTSA
jgi:lipopolysaccharide biosynthesis glycosyltransferase